MLLTSLRETQNKRTVEVSHAVTGSSVPYDSDTNTGWKTFSAAVNGDHEIPEKNCDSHPCVSSSYHSGLRHLPGRVL